MTEATLRRLYIILAVLAIAPIWSVRYLPTADGPSHLYNAWLLRDLVQGGHGMVQEWFAVNWRPYPNWSGHVLLALLMTIVPPLVAEKILVSAIVIFFLYAMWMYSGALHQAGRAFAFLAFPFAWNLSLQVGLYNFSIAVALYFGIVAFWSRRRDRPDARTIVTVALLLVLCYFSHILPAVLAIGSIGLLWLVEARRRPLRTHVLHLLAFIPVLPLLLWFVRDQRGGSVVAVKGTAWGLFSYIMRMSVLLTFDEYQAKLGLLLFVILAALVAATLMRRKWEWSDGAGFVLLTLAMVALYGFAPAGAFGGSMVLERMALFVVLSPLAWIAPRLPDRVTAAIAVLLVLIAMANTAYLVRRYRGLDRRMQELVRSARGVGEETTVLPLIQDVRPAKGSFVPILAHAFDYVSLAKRDVNVANYEAAAGVFPIRFRADPMRAPCQRIVDLTTPVDLAVFAGCAEYVYAWHLPEASPMVRGLDEYYLPVGGSGGGRVYRVRDDSRLAGRRDLSPASQWTDHMIARASFSKPSRGSDIGR